MNILTVLAGILKTILDLFRGQQEQASRQSDHKSGENAVAAKVNADAISEIERANAARDAVVRDLTLHPERVYEHDADEAPD